MHPVKHKLVCFCSRHPLLAMYGMDERGRLFVHVKVYKQNRIYADFIAYGGEVVMCCRECVRWHRIVIRDKQQGTAELKEASPPAEAKFQEEAHDGAYVG